MVLVCKGLLQDTDEKAIIKFSPKTTNFTVLKIRLHCEGCSNRIRKVILKLKEVETVSMDNSKDLVTVKGTMNVEELVSHLQQKLKIDVEVILPIVKKDKDDGERKGKESSNTAKGGADRKEKRVATVSGSRSSSREEQGSGCGGSGRALKADGSKRPEFYERFAYYPVESDQEYRRFMTPEMFSDEDPNACSIL